MTFFIKDGAEVAAYPHDFIDHITFSPDGTRVVYVIDHGQVVIDGVPGPRFDQINALMFSPDSKRVVYVGHNRDLPEKGSAVFVDGVVGKRYDWIDKTALWFSRDGHRMAYAAKLGSNWLAVVDEHAGAEYDGVAGLIFSSNGHRVSYVAKKGNKQLAVVDGKAGSDYDEIGTLTFSPDGKRVAYAARKGEKMLVVLDCQICGEYDEIIKGGPIFNTDGGSGILGNKG